MFVIKFYKEFVKRPKPAEGEGDKMKELVENYLSNAQMCYDLVPLASALGDDPYRDKTEEVSEFL